jgi:hypothetical protein
MRLIPFLRIARARSRWPRYLARDLCGYAPVRTDIGVRCEVNHQITADHGLRESLLIADISLDQREARVLPCLGKNISRPVERLSKPTTE